ncbi:MAG TPA: PLP-dependent cysteine synthase family protein [Conexivisphaerales archaeon]|nr:PLP-dependent cysteine synthase family protein [Conexivisphaerales archaeon]
MAISWNKSASSFDSVLDAIGRTPLVRLNRIPEAEGVVPSIYAKLEFMNPTGSLKDRIYYRMITEAIKRGDLKPGMEILESSTGNAGIACVFVGRALGYSVTIVMPEGMSVERRKIMKALGGEVITTPGGESDVDLCMEKIAEMTKKEPARYWFPDQFSNPDNPRAHYDTTGPEIWDQTARGVDAVVLTQGTGGAITGIGRFLRERNPKVLLYAAEPSEAPLLADRRWGTHSIEGIGDGFVPRNLDLSILTGIVTVPSGEAISMTKRVMKEEGLLIGISSGANLVAALKVARRHPDLRKVVVLFNDNAMRYFSTTLFDVQKEVEVPEREHPMDAYTKGQLDANQGRWEIIR